MEVDAPEGFTPMEYSDVLAADGVYYATWAKGEGRPYTNGDGEEAEVYDAQIYLLLSEKSSPENAQASLDELMELARSRYQIESTSTETCNGQDYTVMSFRYEAEDNPYAQGAAAYGARGGCAVNVEVSSVEGGPDPLTALRDFLRHTTNID